LYFHSFHPLPLFTKVFGGFHYPVFICICIVYFHPPHFSVSFPSPLLLVLLKQFSICIHVALFIFPAHKRIIRTSRTTAQGDNCRTPEIAHRLVWLALTLDPCMVSWCFIISRDPVVVPFELKILTKIISYQTMYSKTTMHRITLMGLPNHKWRWHNHWPISTLKSCGKM
jgi:hypothetical protein